MGNPWLKCKYCGCEVWATTVGGDIENHNCKDQQIAVLKSDLALWRAFWDGMRYVDRHTYENISPHVRALKERELI